MLLFIYLFIFLLFFWGQKCLVGLQGLWFYHGLCVLALQSVLFYIRGLLVRAYCLTTIHSFFFDQIFMARIYWWSPRKSYNGPTLWSHCSHPEHVPKFRGFDSICTQISPFNLFNTTVPMDCGPRKGPDMDADFPHMLGPCWPAVVLRHQMAFIQRNGTRWGANRLSIEIMKDGRPTCTSWCL